MAKVFYRDLTIYPPRFKEGDNVKYISGSGKNVDAWVIEVIPANGLYEQETVEDHIKCDTYTIEFYVYGNKRQRTVTDEDLFDEEGYKDWQERNYDYPEEP